MVAYHRRLTLPTFYLAWNARGGRVISSARFHSAPAINAFVCFPRHEARIYRSFADYSDISSVSLASKAFDEFIR